MSELGQKLIAEVRKVAGERPDFIAPGDCVYVSDGQPSCLIGHALWNLGLVDENTEYRHLNDEGITAASAFLNLDIEGLEIDWLSEVQIYQDARFAWSDAVQRADEVMRDDS